MDEGLLCLVPCQIKGGVGLASFIRVALREFGGERLLKYLKLNGKPKIKQPKNTIGGERND